jgi:hypothetical protein
MQFSSRCATSSPFSPASPPAMGTSALPTWAPHVPLSNPVAFITSCQVLGRRLNRALVRYGPGTCGVAHRRTLRRPPRLAATPSPRSRGGRRRRRRGRSAARTPFRRARRWKTMRRGDRRAPPLWRSRPLRIRPRMERGTTRERPRAATGVRRGRGAVSPAKEAARGGRPRETRRPYRHPCRPSARQAVPAWRRWRRRRRWRLRSASVRSGG